MEIRKITLDTWEKAKTKLKPANLACLVKQKVLLIERKLDNN